MEEIAVTGIILVLVLDLLEKNEKFCLETVRQPALQRLGITDTKSKFHDYQVYAAMQSEDRGYRVANSAFHSNSPA
jgi:hypothetical protein